MTTTADQNRWLGGVAVVLACVGCGGAARSTDAAPVDGNPAGLAPICDGSTAVRLRVFVEPQNVRERHGSIVRVENGYQSMMIDGACDVWIGGGWIEDAMGRDLGWRRGHLDAALEQELRTLLSVNDLGAVQDCVTSTTSDAPTRSLRSATSRARCIAGGPRFEAAWSWVEMHAPDLWNEAAPLDQGIHVEVVVPSDGDNSKAYAWPSGAPLSALILPDGSGLTFTSGVSTPIVGPDAEPLRMLRDEYIADRRAAPAAFFDGQKMMDEHNTSALVYMRDQLPYEDDRGLLPFSDPPVPPAP